MKTFIFAIIVLAMLTVSTHTFAGDRIQFDFEDDPKGWQIPDWAYYQDDHKAKNTEISTDVASTGSGSFKIDCDFPGDLWTAALVERERDMDLTDYETISVDVYLPKGAPRGKLLARFVLTIGDGWYFTEQRDVVPLIPGQWVTLTARLESEYSEEQSDWKGRKHKSLYHHINKIKKIAVRIEYNASPPNFIGPRYEGPVYIDNLVIE